LKPGSEETLNEKRPSKLGLSSTKKNKIIQWLSSC